MRRGREHTAASPVTPLTRLAGLASSAPRRILLVAAAVALAAALAGWPAVGALSPFTSDHPGTESARAHELVGAASGTDPYYGLAALVRSRAPVDSPGARARVRRVAATLRAEPLVSEVEHFYSTRDPALVSRDGRSTYLLAGLRPAPLADQLAAARRLEAALAERRGVTLGGRAAFYQHGNDTAKTDLVRAEAIALPLLFAITLWVFRGVVAALMPLLVGGFTIALSLLGLRVLGELTDVSTYALNITTALGLGLAVDYSLLILSRYREEARAAGYGREALRRTLERAGRTVLFSGLTVSGAGAALLVFPQPFLRSVGLGTILVASLAATVALLVLPAALALLGRRVDALAPASWQQGVERDARASPTGRWYRLSRFVARRPRLIAPLCAALLLALSLPIVDLRVTQVDHRVLPTSSPDRQVTETLRADFPSPYRTAPVIVAVRAPAAARAELRGLAERLSALPGAAAASAPERLSDSVWRIDVLSEADPLSEQSQDLVSDVRAVVPPALALVGGESAALVDLKESLGERLPLAAAILIALTLILLFRATGSVILPLKTVVMNALTLAATFGLLVLIFQNGALETVLGYTSAGALEASVLVLIFAVAWGLATDYGVFLLARIREAREGGVSDSHAVSLGLQRTGRIITAAAALLCVALLALASAEHSLVKQVGIGTALAVAIDASIVRALLVPSLMRLLGRLNWWCPRALSWARPTLAQGPPPPPPAEALSQTRYCDAKHPAVRALAGELTAELTGRAAAARLFRWVRDEVPYAFGPWGVPASTTLAERAGTCTNKANLLIALLRAAGIPAAYGILRVNAREYFGALGPRLLTRHASRHSVHIYAAAHLDGRWVKCDPSTDRELAELTSHFSRQTRLVEWDAAHDAIDFLDPAHVYEDLGLFADIDARLDRAPRNALPEILALGNAYLRFIRTHPPFADADTLLAAYLESLEGAPIEPRGGPSVVAPHDPAPP
ncbi:MAG: MMPL family transporter [Solirubrobacterales bacterium]|nr:MMPL family transporter [Solirubrobacterales bacterium]